MEVILLEKINKLGNMGDTVEVKQGFGRNFLIPTGKALRATTENKKFFENSKAKLLKENKEAIDRAEKVRSEVESLNLVVVRSASDTGILYGSVTTRDVTNLIGQEGVKLSRKQIALDKPIKELGVFSVNVTLHPEVESKIKLRVVRSLGDTTSDGEDDKKPDSISGAVDSGLNEGLLDEGVSLKNDDVVSEETQIENETE